MAFDISLLYNVDRLKVESEYFLLQQKFRNERNLIWNEVDRALITFPFEDF